MSHSEYERSEYDALITFLNRKLIEYNEIQGKWCYFCNSSSAVEQKMCKFSNCGINSCSINQRSYKLYWFFFFCCVCVNQILREKGRYVRRKETFCEETRYCGCCCCNTPTFPMLDTWTIHKPPPKLPTDLLLRVHIRTSPVLSIVPYIYFVHCVYAAYAMRLYWM